MAIYYFCSGFTLQSVTVTANFGSCSDFRTFTDDYCHYETWSRDISFTVSGTHPALYVRFKYWQNYYKNGVLEYSGFQTIPVTIPAGGAQTYYYEDLIGYPHDCKENRYCNFSGGIVPQTQV